MFRRPEHRVPFAFVPVRPWVAHAGNPSPVGGCARREPKTAKTPGRALGKFSARLQKTSTSVYSTANLLNQGRPENRTTESITCPSRAGCLNKERRPACVVEPRSISSSPHPALLRNAHTKQILLDRTTRERSRYARSVSPEDTSSLAHQKRR